jgi:hypothetical protein
MYSNAKKHILFEEINCFSLWIAVYFRFRGFEVHYLFLSNPLNRQRVYRFLEKQSILGLSYEILLGSPHYEAYHRPSLLSDQLYEKFLKDSPLNKLIESYYEMDQNSLQKWHLASKQQVEFRILSYGQLVIFARHFSNLGNCSVQLFATNTQFTQWFLELEALPFQNLCPSWVSSAEKISKILKFVSKRIVGRLIGSLKKRLLPPSTKLSPAHTEQKVDVANYEILYFPHLGIYYSNLFIKDHFYNPNPESPFFKSKILHISLGEPQSLLHRSIEYYEQESIPYVSYSDPVYKNLKIFFEIVSLFKKDGLILKELKHSGWGRFLFYFLNFYRLQSYLRFAKSFKKAKIVLVGYDMLFPPFLSAALAISEIRTIATQERFMATFWARNKISLDYYFVCGRVVQEHIEKYSNFFAIQQVIPLGLVRQDLFYQAAQRPVDQKYAHIKSKYMVILVMDFHSAKSKLENRLSVGNSWKNNKKFYNDIINLSIAIPEAFFVIKGKNTDIIDNPEFRKIISQIEALPNLMIETDLETYTPEKMASIADAGIAMYTNYADEFLAAGKPMFIYDFFGFPKQYFDYEGLPVVVDTYPELKDRVGRFVRKQEYMDAKQLAQMQTRFYENSYDGKVINRLHHALHSIYQGERPL